MKSFQLLCILLIIFSQFRCSEIPDTNQYSLSDIDPVILNQKGNEVFQYWILENSAHWFDSIIGEMPALSLYIDSLEIVLGKDPLNEVVRKRSTQTLTLDTLEIENGDEFNAVLINSGFAGSIKPINYLEAALLNYQLNRYPLLSHPTEFVSFILQNSAEDSLKVYFGAGDQPWPPKHAVILEAVLEDLKNGWTHIYNLHNHYEPAENNYVGILAPSLADVQYLRYLTNDYRLKNVLITNGFHTVKIESHELFKFKAHGS